MTTNKKAPSQSGNSAEGMIPPHEGRIMNTLLPTASVAPAWADKTEIRDVDRIAGITATDYQSNEQSNPADTVTGYIAQTFGPDATWTDDEPWIILNTDGNGDAESLSLPLSRMQELVTLATSLIQAASGTAQEEHDE